MSYFLQAFKLCIITSVLLIVGCTNSKREEITPNQEDLNIDADSIAKTFEELTVDTPPDYLYEVFNKFSLSHFGAETDPYYYVYGGEDLINNEENGWNYISERSATISWETNLPAKTYVKYGKTNEDGAITEAPERYFYNHVHYLKDLEPETQYSYRLISFDERGNKTESAERTFRTKKIPGAVYIPGDMGEPPYVLDQANTTYLVTQDITAGRSAFDIKAGGVTLDLGGHTIIHANQLVEDLDYRDIEKSGVGIRRINDAGQSGLKIYNGIIKQGEAENNQDYLAGENMLTPDPERNKVLYNNKNRGFSNIEITKQDDVEIAGVTFEYHLPQTWSIRFDDALGKYDIHHNVFLDKGTQMFSRHGLGGARTMGFSGSEYGDLKEGGNDLQVHHNLIKRTRQNGINLAQKIFSNEIYVDSWVVNSFAVQPGNIKAQVYDNKIFLTGYYACGILWASEDLNVRNNFIHMEGVRTMIDPPNEGRRLIETWGEQDVLAGLRLTNYSKGGQKRDNFTYEDNIIIGRARNGSEMRGTEFYSDYSVKNLVFKDNIVKITAEDSMTTKAATVDTQGAYNDKSTHLPLYYIDNTMISNISHIRFGDDYGQGSNHRFINCELIRIGDNPNYHAFVFAGGSSVFNHVLLDCDFGEGVEYNDVYWEHTSSLSNYSIQWTLTVEANPGAEVRITDRFGNSAYTGSAGSDGTLSTPLTQSIIRPVEWTEDGKQVYVNKKSVHQEEVFSPYSITVKSDGKEKTESFDMNKKYNLDMRF